MHRRQSRWGSGLCLIPHPLTLPLSTGDLNIATLYKPVTEWIINWWHSPLQGAAVLPEIALERDKMNLWRLDHQWLFATMTK